MGEFFAAVIFFGIMGYAVPDAPDAEVLKKRVLAETGAVRTLYHHIYKYPMGHSTNGTIAVVCPDGEEFYVDAELGMFGFTIDPQTCKTKIP